MKKFWLNRSIADSVSMQNLPPSDEQKVEINAKIQELEAKFEALVGCPSSDLQDNHQVTKRARKIMDSIYQYRSLLSCIKGIPDEIWQRIFVFAACDRNGTSRPKYLHNLCSVCRQWRYAAINFCPLWTTLPTIWLIREPHHFQADIEYTRLYITLSGTLPVTINYGVSEAVWEQHGESARDLLQMLINESHRWVAAYLYLPLHTLEHLSPIQGNIPVLSKLDLYVARRDHGPAGELFRVDCFSESPALKELILHAYYSLWASEVQLIVNLPPLSQIEHFTTIFYRDQVCCQLMEAPSPKLRTLIYTTDHAPPLPSAPLVLPNLEKLIITMSGGTVPSYLDCLTLPALSDFQLQALVHPLPGQISQSLLDLVRRSGCSLKRLAVDANDQLNLLPEIYALSPELTYLDIGSNIGHLEQLVLEPDSPTPVLPKLEVLKLRPLANSHSTDFPPQALTQVIKSRTEDLFGFRDQGLRTLSTIQFSGHFDIPNWELRYLRPVLETVSSENASLEDAALGDLALRVSTLLHQHFGPSGLSQQAFTNVELHFTMGKLMRELENLDFHEQNSRAFLWRGIPRALRNISNKPSGVIPGDRIFCFRSRAGKLVKKWRPFLKRDIQTSPFSWSYDGEGAVNLVYKYNWEGIYAEEDIWDEIFGIGTFTSWYPSQRRRNAFD